MCGQACVVDSVIADIVVTEYCMKLSPWKVGRVFTSSQVAFSYSIRSMQSFKSHRSMIAKASSRILEGEYYPKIAACITSSWKPLEASSKLR